MDKQTLTLVGEWAQARVASGEEPPFTFHKLKQLVDITNDLVEGMDATAVFVGAPPALPENVISIETFRSAAPANHVMLPT